MSDESDFLVALQALATNEAARGLLDDVAVLSCERSHLILTHDMIVEGVHFLPEDPPEDVAWKLVAVNLSDLAAKGAVPVGMLLGYGLGGDPHWDAAFVRGLGRSLNGFGLALLGGDTVAMPPGAPRTFGLTAIGRSAVPVPSRAGAADGDHLWVSGSIGDAGLGLRIARGELDGPSALLERYRLPSPRLELGQRLAPIVSAMMDVSDGLLLDARRMADASGAAICIDLDSLPLSDAFLQAVGDERAVRIAAATSGDDYELLFTASADRATEVLALSDQLGIPLSRIGSAKNGAGLQLIDHGMPVPLPQRLGFEHSTEDLGQADA
jgi:thiamine-monophosphate kinase